MTVAFLNLSEGKIDNILKTSFLYPKLFHLSEKPELSRSSGGNVRKRKIPNIWTNWMIWESCLKISILILSTLSSPSIQLIKWNPLPSFGAVSNYIKNTQWQVATERDSFACAFLILCKISKSLLSSLFNLWSNRNSLCNKFNTKNVK